MGLLTDWRAGIQGFCETISSPGKDCFCLLKIVIQKNWHCYYEGWSTQHERHDNECKPMSCCSPVVWSTKMNVHMFLVVKMIILPSSHPFLQTLYVKLGLLKLASCVGGRKLFPCAHRRLKCWKEWLFFFSPQLYLGHRAEQIKRGWDLILNPWVIILLWHSAIKEYQCTDVTAISFLASNFWL